MGAGQYTIGVDFGTLSARAVVVDVADGRILGRGEGVYPHGVLTQTLPDECTPLPPQWALQVPEDYLQALESSVRMALDEAGVGAEQVVGLSCDFTSCTVLPTDENATALCQLPDFAHEPHAYAKLWKHHAAQDQARRIEALARARKEPFLERYGGRVSSEWLLPKALQLLEQAPQVAQATQLFLEGADWVVTKLTGTVCRSACCAGFKRFWSEEEGDVSANFLTCVDPRLPHWLNRTLKGEVRQVWESAGHLCPEWARRLGLGAHTVVGAGTIDAHAAVLGSGICQGGQALLILGTSGCQLLLDQRAVNVPGICGYVQHAIVPKLYAYEAGQPCVGDLLAWFVERCVPASYQQQAQAQQISVHQLLSQLAAQMEPGESGLLALDWWNGQRTPLVDDDLSGLVLGLTLQTTPEQLYRALMEAIAFGTRLIFDTFQAAGLDTREIVVCGGIARKNPLMMQIYADVLQCPVTVADTDQASALGSAILAAVAAGVHRSVEQAAQAMTRPGQERYLPNPDRGAVYERLYGLYGHLVRHFGADSPVMKQLLNLRQTAISHRV